MHTDWVLWRLNLTSVLSTPFLSSSSSSPSGYLSSISTWELRPCFPSKTGRSIVCPSSWPPKGAMALSSWCEWMKSVVVERVQLDLSTSSDSEGRRKWDWESQIGISLLLICSFWEGIQSALIRDFSISPCADHLFSLHHFSQDKRYLTPLINEIEAEKAERLQWDTVKTTPNKKH